MDEPSNFALKLQEWIDMDRAEFERLTLGLPPDVAFQTLLLLLLNLYAHPSCEVVGVYSHNRTIQIYCLSMEAIQWCIQRTPDILNGATSVVGKVEAIEFYGPSHTSTSRWVKRRSVRYSSLS